MLGFPFDPDPYPRSSGRQLPHEVVLTQIFVYVALNFVFSFVGYDVFEQNL